jgi:hypothetical protein
MHSSIMILCAQSALCNCFSACVDQVFKILTFMTWLIRLLRNFVTCKIFSFIIKFFLIILSASFLSLRLILIDECILFFRFSTRVNQIDSRASVKSLYASIFLWNSFIELSYYAISTSCMNCSNQTSSSWIDLMKNSFFQIDRHWINWFAMFFLKIVNTILFFVRDKLIIVIKMSIFSFFNFWFILFLYSVELISLTAFFENMIIFRFFHWTVSFNFVVWALIFWFVILIVFLLITFVQIDDEEFELEF